VPVVVEVKMKILCGKKNGNCKQPKTVIFISSAALPPTRSILLQMETGYSYERKERMNVSPFRTWSGNFHRWGNWNDFV
jgi:hypothetical protein